jgi:hypothetical protein
VPALQLSRQCFVFITPPRSVQKSAKDYLSLLQLEIGCFRSYIVKFNGLAWNLWLQSTFWHLMNIGIRNFLTEVEHKLYKNILSKCKKVTSDKD